MSRKQERISIVICVHDAVDAVKACLRSLVANRTVPFQLILVDDGSGAATRDYLRSFCGSNPCVLIRNESTLGYTASANMGIRLSRAPFIILLNSDTIVTRRWIEKLLECMQSEPKVGIVGPLSNAASWQSVPSLRGENALAAAKRPDRMSIDRMAEIVEAASEKAFPSVIFLNGFCYMIRGEVITRIGLLDDAAFPMGYGEEDDYSLRAGRAGFLLKVADHCYIYHKKTSSFSPEERAYLSNRSRKTLDLKYSKHTMKSCIRAMALNEGLARVRARIAAAIQSDKQR